MSIHEREPAISVIIPTRNRVDMLERFLSAIAEQSTEEPYEVIVVDNGSTDRTQEVIAAVSKRSPHVRTITELRSGSAAACHAGAVAARAPLIVFLDDDMGIGADFVESHLSAHRANPGACILGRVVSAQSRHPFERMLAYIFDGARQTLVKGKPVAIDYWSGNVSLSRDLYLEMGGYDQIFARLGYGKDIDFGHRLLKRGIEMLFCPEAVTYHHFIERFGERLRKSYRSGQAYGYVRDNYPDLPVPEVVTRNWVVPGGMVVAFCRVAAAILEPFDRGLGAPIKPLAFVYDLGLQTATGLGLDDYRRGRRSVQVEAARAGNTQAHE